jgi:hypothetical protein
MRDVTIARLIVGKRHCRVLILGNITSGGIGIVQDFGRTKVLTTNFKLHSFQYLNPQQLQTQFQSPRRQIAQN